MRLERRLTGAEGNGPLCPPRVFSRQGRMRAMLESSATFGESVPPDRRSMIPSARVVPEMYWNCYIIFTFLIQFF